MVLPWSFAPFRVFPLSATFSQGCASLLGPTLNVKLSPNFPTTEKGARKDSPPLNAGGAGPSGPALPRASVLIPTARTPGRIDWTSRPVGEADTDPWFPTQCSYKKTTPPETTAAPSQFDRWSAPCLLSPGLSLIHISEP